MNRLVKLVASCAAALVASAASAQLPFPPNWTGGPTGAAKVNVYPYPGQCVSSTAPGSVGAALNAGGTGTPVCTTASAPSFACEPVAGVAANQSAGGYRACGQVVPPTLVNLVVPGTQPKFQWEFLNPPDYAKSTDARYPGADYYEIAVHEAWGFQAIADVPATMGAGAFPPVPSGWTLPGRLFPNPKDAPAVAGTWTPNAAGTPNGMQWTGLVCVPTAPATTCTCPAEASAAYKSAYCTAGGAIPAGSPLLTPIWGVGQRKVATTGTTLTDVLTAAGTFPVAFPGATAPATEWSANDYVATWPSISIRATTGTPVVVNWVNEFPNNHLFCPHPEAADWPCGIDRTFMGVKATIDPATSPFVNAATRLPYNKVNQFGSPQQPDNSWVTHLHGGEIPPATDGFAEKWYGNARTGSYYSPQPWLLSPAFVAPEGALTDKLVTGPAGTQLGALFRPGGAPGPGVVSSSSNDTYAYPMVNGESTIWFHDHTLGKTHHNVIAGPAGFFPVKDPSRHGAVVNGLCQVATPQNPAACAYTWLDPLTEPRNPLGQPSYDLFMAIQDRDFSDDGQISFPNGMAQLPAGATGPNGAGLAACVPNAAAGIACAPPGSTEVTPGSNPQVHPTWVGEYFAGNSLVNGVLWPKKTVEAGFYRMRIVDGSDSRCYTIGFSTIQPVGGTAAGNGTKPKNDVPFTVIADDQGYLQAPAAVKSFSMCPGERYEVLVDFTRYAGRQIFMTNSAAAPFPNGLNEPWRAGTLYPEMGTIMRFDVSTVAGVQACPAGGLTWPAAPGAKGCVAIPAVVEPTFDAIAARARAWMRANTTWPVAAEPAGAPAATALPIAAVRQLYLNEKVDATTLFSLGLQINGVPFEYDVTETPKAGTYELWHVINLTVDAHPIHPHLVKFQTVQRVPFGKGAYLRLLTGSNTGTPGPAPGNGMVLTPDVLPTIAATAVPTLPAVAENGFKDAVQAPPGQVTTIVARWGGSWNGAEAACSGTGMCFDSVTSGPYVWHCHINSHEDSEMMRTSLVVK